MKKLRQVLKELPSRKVVFAFGRFQPPTTGHELLVNIVKKVASAQKADHVIFASRTHDKKSNPLPVDRKVYYLKRMFPKTNFVAANDEVRTFIEAAKMLSGKYKNLVMIAGSDRVPEYKKILEKYNGDVFHFDTVEVVSAGERDPDADSASGMSGTKMRAAAADGDYKKFKTGLPKALTDLDGRRLMNEIRTGMGMEVVKEQVKFETNDTREKYYSGQIFNIGEKVTDGQNIFEIIDRGSNYITVVNESGATSKKWLNSVRPIVVEDVKPGYAPKQISYKGYTTKNFDRSEDAAKAFQDTIDREGDPVAILNAIKATDTYMGLNDKHLTGEKFTDQEKETWIAAHEKARESLNRVGEFAHHQDYWHTHQHELEGVLIPYDETGKEEMREQKERLEEMKFSSIDRIKVARIIAGSLGVPDVEEKSGPAEMVNQGLRFIKNKRMTPEAWNVIKNMLQMATDAGIKFDQNIVKNKVEESVDKKNGDSDKEVEHDEKPDHGKVGRSLGGSNDSHRRMKVKYALGEESEREELEDEGLSDEEIDDMIGKLSDDDYLEAYDDEELSVIDDETGEHLHDLKEEALMEVLSRAERVRAKIRFAKSEAKRERKTRIALKTRSTSKTINTRARRMAVNMMKMRIAKKPLNTLSVGEKERIERIIAKRKVVIGRIAMKMAPRVRKIENDRLVHRTYTKG
jgi:nicotinamide mononucleotide adenylyltransferase